MIRFSYPNLFFVLISLLAFSCGTDEDPFIPEETCVKEVFESGLYIANEGPFSNGSGTITYFNTTSKAIQEEAFAFNNCDDPLGSIVQSIATFENKAYIVVNNSNKIIVADASSLEKSGEITGLELPRYFLPVGDNKAFVSQWGADGVTGSIAVVDLTSLNILKTIPANAGPENMILINDEVFVANAGGFARDSVVTVINVGTEEVTSTIILGDNPQSFVVDNSNRLWCLSKGFSDFYEPTNNTFGQLDLIENGQVTQSIEISNSSRWLAINNAGNELYYIGAGGIYKQSVTSSTAETTPMIAGNFYSLAVDFNTNQIYASDALDFSSKGIIYRYNTDGTAIDSFESGIVPTGFWFD